MTKTKLLNIFFFEKKVGKLLKLNAMQKKEIDIQILSSSKVVWSMVTMNRTTFLFREMIQKHVLQH